MQTVVVIGSGAREHALAHKLAFGDLESSKAIRQVFVVGGNAGIAREFECIRIDKPGIHELTHACIKLAPTLVVIGPENYLEDGVSDCLRSHGIAVFGPSKQASLLESSKYFAKTILKKSGVPHASFERFGDHQSALRHIDDYPHEKIVIKVDGLCAGKGVRVCLSKDEAKSALHELYQENGFGRLRIQDTTIIIEDYLLGREVSVFGAAHGNDVVLFCPMQDYKRLRDRDQGPNTGGMGAVGPLGDNLTQRASFLEQIKERIFLPTLHAMNSLNMPFSGLLYAGLMLTEQGPTILEFNVRFGDPETQALLHGTKADIYPLLHSIAHGHHIDVDYWQQQLLTMRPTVSIVAASDGYPDKSSLPQPIKLPHYGHKNTKIYWAKTGFDQSLGLVSDNGRVLSATASAHTIEEARSIGYKLVSEISFSGMQYRLDIGTNITPLKL